MNQKLRPPFWTAVILFAMSLGAATWLAAETPVESSTAAVVTPPPVAVVPPAPVVTSAPAASAEFIGATACLSCHEKQANFTNSVHGHSLTQAKGIDAEKTCETCHGAGSLHAAAAGDKTNPGFATIKVFKGMAAQDLNKTCMECHQDENRMHWVGSRHEARNVACNSCHSVHAARNDKLLLVKPKVEEVCAQCHKDVVAKIHRNSHMPIDEGKMDCSSCHNPHGSATAKNLKLASVNDTCYSCHADKRGPFLFEHQPVRENCVNCHDAHGSHNEKMLNARQPFLCQRCHNGTRHPSVAYDGLQIAAGSPKLLGESCTNCHVNVHGSNHPSGRYFVR